jgi:hypothetical protein
MASRELIAQVEDAVNADMEARARAVLGHAYKELLKARQAVVEKRRRYESLCELPVAQILDQCPSPSCTLSIDPGCGVRLS